MYANIEATLQGTFQRKGRLKFLFRNCQTRLHINSIINAAVIELKRFETTTFKAQCQESTFHPPNTKINTPECKVLGKYTIIGPLLGWCSRNTHVPDAAPQIILYPPRLLFISLRRYPRSQCTRPHSNFASTTPATAILSQGVQAAPRTIY